MSWTGTTAVASTFAQRTVSPAAAWADPAPVYAAATPKTLVGDINGDGRDDVVRYSFGMLPTSCTGLDCHQGWIAYALCSTPRFCGRGSAA